MKIKVSETTPIQLNWLVAKIEGITYHVKWLQTSPPACYSTDWSQGCPIIERELLAPEPLLDSNCALIKWRCRNWRGDGSDFYGPTPLVAAMRCYVSSCLGDTVEVPNEICE